MNKNTLIIPGLMCLLICGIIYSTYHLEERTTLRTEIFAVGKGFGYHIVHDNKVLITQVNIPAVQGSIPFTTKKDAEKTADLIINKILKAEDPKITIADLEAMKIDIPHGKHNTE